MQGKIHFSFVTCKFPCVILRNIINIYHFTMKKYGMEHS